MSDDKYLQVRVPEEIHRQAKIESAKTGKPLQEILEQLVKLWLEGKIKIEE